MAYNGSSATLYALDGTAPLGGADGRAQVPAVAGAVRWTARAAAQLAWSADGALIGLDDGCAVRYDLADGHVIARQCGWGFGKFREPIVSR